MHDGTPPGRGPTAGRGLGHLQFCSGAVRELFGAGRLASATGLSAVFANAASESEEYSNRSEIALNNATVAPGQSVYDVCMTYRAGCSYVTN